MRYVPWENSLETEVEISTAAELQTRMYWLSPIRVNITPALQQDLIFLEKKDNYAQPER